MYNCKNTSSEPVLFSERHLQIIWYIQKYLSPISTQQGQKVEVIFPGKWNDGPGPDFLEAHLLIDGMVMKGAVEIDLEPQGWIQHGHYQDTRYSQVVLHVSLNTTKTAIRDLHGREIPHVAIGNFLQKRPENLTNLLSIDMYPYRRFQQKGFCNKELFSHLSQNQVTSLLSQAADWRLECKGKNLLALSKEGYNSITLGIAIALGYKNNPIQFEAIYKYLLSLQKQGFIETELISVALGITGFFEARYQQKWETSEKFCYLRDIWNKKKEEISFKVDLDLIQIRPLNHPIRRLILLVKIIVDASLDRLSIMLEKAWSDWSKLELTIKNVKLFYESLIHLIPEYRDDYWNHYYTFELQRKESPLIMIGKDLKREICINVFLPYLYQVIKKNGFPEEEFQAFNVLYSSINAAKTGKSCYLSNRFFAGTVHEKILNSLKYQQGAYQIHKDFCMHFEANCFGCPFVSSYYRSIY